MKKNLIIVGLSSALLLSSCYHTPEKIDPKIDFSVQDKYLLSLPSSFEPLSPLEKSHEWAKEYRIGVAFAHELDLYQAITAFKRAIILIEPEHIDRIKEIEYGIFLCYYLGRKYQDALYTFENTPLKDISTSFPAAEDLSLLLFDCYTKEHDDKKAERILLFIQQNYRDAAKKLNVYSSILKADTDDLKKISEEKGYGYLSAFVSDYEKSKKSISKARHLNAICPGAGYFYLGQTQSGITAVLLNGSFIAASAYFFSHGNIPAGAIFTGFEAGWYLGGIYGAGQEAKFYNERIYETRATKLMNEKGLFPGFMIRYAF